MPVLSGCVRDDQVRFKNRMEGVWKIDEVIVLINQDGSTSPVSETDGVGTLILTRPEFDDGVFLDYSLSLTNSNYSWSNQPFKTDEARKRVFFYYFYCPDLFGCDMVATIEMDKRNEQRWSFFRQVSQGNATHRKVTWTLTRE